MNNYLITGYWGEPHVTAENDRGFNAAVFGPGRFVLPVGEQLRAEYIGNNTIRLYDGKLLNNGALAGIPAGKYIDLLTPEAGQGMNRNDLVIFQYRKDPSTLVETGEFILLQGVETSGAAVDPALTQDDLLTDEATQDQMALYRIPVTGAGIGEPEPLFEVARNVASGGSGALNLMDNSDFRHPVNSNGQTSYRGLGFSIDRWVVPNDTSALTVGDGFVLMQNDDTASACNFVNRLPAGTLKNGKTYTGVICFNDGTVVFGSGVCASTGVVLTDRSRNIYMQIATSTDYDLAALVVAAGTYDRLFYAALYEGEYTESTLPAYVPKGYGVELAVSNALGDGNAFELLESADYPGCYYHMVDGVIEWLNPPLNVGNEYRTVERYKGNVVYAKAVNLGTLPNTTDKSVTLNIVGTKIVAMRAIATTSSGVFETLPITYGEAIAATAYVEEKKILIGTFRDFSSYTGTAFVKYTK